MQEPRTLGSPFYFLVKVKIFIDAFAKYFTFLLLGVCVLPERSFRFRSEEFATFVQVDRLHPGMGSLCLTLLFLN